MGGHAGESVDDPFLGVETTMIADEETGGVCDAIELNPKSVSMAIRRWEQATGRKAEHVRRGIA